MPERVVLFMMINSLSLCSGSSSRHPKHTDVGWFNRCCFDDESLLMGEFTAYELVKLGDVVFSLGWKEFSGE